MVKNNSSNFENKKNKETTLIEKNMLFNVNIKRRERNSTSIFKHI